MTHALYTGNIRGSVVLDDGSEIDVSPDVVFLDSQEKALEAAHHIGIRHEEEGHPAHRQPRQEGYDPLVDEFHHTCTEHCGSAYRDHDAQVAAFNARLERLGHGHLVGTPKHAAKIEHLAAMRAGDPAAERNHHEALRAINAAETPED